MEQKWKITFYMSHFHASLPVVTGKTITNQRYTYLALHAYRRTCTDEYTFHSRLTATHAIDEGCNRRDIINSWFVINFAIKYSFTLCLAWAYLFIECFSSKRHWRWCKPSDALVACDSSSSLVCSNGCSFSLASGVRAWRFTFIMPQSASIVAIHTCTCIHMWIPCTAARIRTVCIMIEGGKSFQAERKTFHLHFSVEQMVLINFTWQFMHARNGFYLRVKLWWASLIWGHSVQQSPVSPVFFRMLSTMCPSA